MASQDQLLKLSNLPIINTGGYGSAEELAITITSMKILRLPSSFWIHTTSGSTPASRPKKSPRGNTAPAFTPKLIKSCSSAREAEEELLVFLSPPDDCYMKKKIPGESAKMAWVKPSCILKAFSLPGKCGGASMGQSPTPGIGDIFGA